jgi:cytochrome c oxidase subunit 1
MSHPAAIPATHVHDEHEHGGFISTYVFSQDHKMIGKQCLFMALFMRIFGGLFALLVRWQLAFRTASRGSVGCRTYV